MSDLAPGIGRRERKRQETKNRIVTAGLRLFGLHGYEATTLDAIAAEAGISRRTFFHYFESKDDILLSMQSGLGEMLVAAIDAQPLAKPPLQSVRDAMVGLAAPYQPAELIAIDRLMRSSETVIARKQAAYVRDEALVFAALQARYPREPEMSLRLVASLCISAVRLSLDAFTREEGRRPIAELVAEIFDALPVVTSTK